ncbi:MAG TPA: hypothetical protein VM408_05930 [Methylomirabilota bacterium]|nr:hypothetical protein [Methylomirabilota bacterium]
MARKYDDIGWHDGAAAEVGRPAENGFAHIGFYLGWIVKRGLHAPAAIPADHVAAVRDGSMTGADLADDVDGKLVDDVLSDDGRAFTDEAYEPYLDAYAKAFAAAPEYGVEDTPANAARVERMLDTAFASWRAGGRADPVADETDDGSVPASDRVGSPEAQDRLFVEPRRTAVDLERILVARLGLAATAVSSSPASEWGSSLVTRALKRLGVRPRDATVVSALAGASDSVMVALYAVPGVAAPDLEREFAGAIHRPSARPWEPTEMGGHRVLRSRDREFDVVYWAVDGVVPHLGADVGVDLAPLVAALTVPPLV